MKQNTKLSTYRTSAFQFQLLMTAIFMVANFFGGVEPCYAAAPSGLITSMVGHNSGDEYPSESAKLTPTSLIFDTNGNLYLVDRRSLRVRWIEQSTGTTEPSTGLVDLGTATIHGVTAASLGLVGAGDVGIDGLGRLYVVDTYGNRVWRRSTAGVWSAFAGTGASGFSGDGDTALSATLNAPNGIAIDNSGNVFISDTANQRIRRVDATSGVISTVAGGGASLGDSGPAGSAKLANPRGLAFDANGNLVIADTSNQRVRRITSSGGQITANSTINTVAGNGLAGGGGDGGAATAARLSGPSDIAISSGNEIFIADTGNHLVRRVDVNGNISTFAGTFKGFYGDGGAANSAGLDSPQGVSFARNGDLWISDTGNDRIRRVHSGIINSYVGRNNGDGYPAEIGNVVPTGMQFASNGDLYLIDRRSLRPRWVDASTATTDLSSAIIDTVDMPAAFVGASDLALDSLGRLYVVDQYGSRVWRRTGNSWDVIAGNGSAGFSGDGDLGTRAMLNSPTGIAVDAVGNAYISDATNQRIRRVDAITSIITTIAGGGGSLGDGGAAGSAKLANPRGLSLDKFGNLYVADTSNHRIRKITAIAGVINSSCIISTIAGTGIAGGGGDGGSALNARLSQPADVWVDSSLNVFIADNGNHEIRWVEFSSSNIFIVAGSFKGFGGDGGVATSALLDSPQGVTLSADGDLWISDTTNERIRRVDIAAAATPTPTLTNTPLPSSTPTPTRTATATNTPTRTSTAQFTATPTWTPTRTPTRTNTPTSTATTQPSTPSPAVSASSTPSPTITSTPTLTLTPSSTPSFTWTPSPAATSFRISGQVRYAGSNVAVPGVTIRLSGRSTSTTTTNSDGFYDFGEVAGGIWFVTPEKFGDRGSSLSSLDAVYIQQKLLSSSAREFSPDQMLAADVNGNGSVDLEDASLLLQFKVGTVVALPLAKSCLSDWIFRPDLVTNNPNSLVTSPLSGPTNCRQGSVAFAPLAQPATLNFTAIVIGDTTENWQASSSANSIARRSRSALVRRGFKTAP